MYGRKASLPTTTIMEPPPMKTYNASSWLAYLNHYIPTIHEQAKTRIIAAQKRQQKYYNR
ncbi:hypothetical protein BDC45DRAFT_415767, partial [Circinella umbellata]